ncbi:MAG: hypothetical protein GX033_00590 [Firmicutes bacterium]|nr:hypothetical protein [Bacillota bacterium]
MDVLDRLVDRHFLASELARESTEKAGLGIDELLARQPDTANPFASRSFLLAAKAEVEQTLAGTYDLAKFGTLVPVGLWGFKKGMILPDKDISLLGIGKHRFFLFHSALGLVVLRHFYNLWRQNVGDDPGWFERVKFTIAGTALGTAAVGVGVHLLIDTFQPKSVVFPFFGSLVKGTLVDDNIWLLGNSLWAFKVGYDVFALSMAKELDAAKQFVAEYFGSEQVEI